MNKSQLQTISAFEQWLRDLPRQKGVPAKGSLAGALVVLESLKRELNLNIEAHTAKGGSQIRGASGAAAQRILLSFGEMRPLLVEGGRTNRGLRGTIAALLHCLKHSPLKEMPNKERLETIQHLQLLLVEAVRDIHAQKKIRFVFDPSKTTYELIVRLLEVAAEEGKHGSIAEYLVGAKLQLRFPKLQIENKRISAADEQGRRAGDFVVNRTAFHVTVAPSVKVMDRCRQNLEKGIVPYLLVPEKVAIGARQNAEQCSQGRIVVTSIESFVAQNIDEMDCFESSGQQLLKLLRTYNARVDEVENDKSLLIEIPPNLGS